MNPAVRKSKRSGDAPHSRAKKRFITSAEARRRAIRHVTNRLFCGAPVLDGATANWSAFNVRRDDVWLVYKNLEGLALRASEIVVVCKRTGRVLYEGSAQDEG